MGSKRNSLIDQSFVSIFFFTTKGIPVGGVNVSIGANIVAPGQLGYNSGTLTANTYTFTVPNSFGTKNIYVAAHAVVEVK